MFKAQPPLSHFPGEALTQAFLDRVEVSDGGPFPVAPGLPELNVHIPTTLLQLVRVLVQVVPIIIGVDRGTFVGPLIALVRSWAFDSLHD